MILKKKLFLLMVFLMFCTKGHIDLLKFCKKIGKKVYLGINSDSSVKRLKGKKRPYNYLKIRIKHLKKQILLIK